MDMLRTFMTMWTARLACLCVGNNGEASLMTFDSLYTKARDLEWYAIFSHLAD
jgi:hypothetical protein